GTSHVLFQFWLSLRQYKTSNLLFSVSTRRVGFDEQESVTYNAGIAHHHWSALAPRLEPRPRRRTENATHFGELRTKRLDSCDGRSHDLLRQARIRDKQQHQS